MRVSKGISISALLPLLILACEVLGITSLYLAPEAVRWVFILPFFIGFLWLLKVRLSDRWLLGTEFLLVVVGLTLGLVGKLAIAKVLTAFLIPSHTVLWLARNPKGYRYWRLGLGFLELVLAAILAPETYMFLFIFLFMMLGSLALSLGFLERNFSEHREAETLQRLNPSFVLAVLGLSFLTFLSSLVIFPVLPRSNWSGGVGNTAAVGYTEIVSFQTSTLGWAQGNPRPLVWIFSTGTKEWPKLLPFGLVRGKVLEVFTGEEWRSGSKQLHYQSSLPDAQEDLKILRDPMSTEVLPSPYSTLAVASEGARRGSRYTSGEWFSMGQREKRAEYRLWLGEQILENQETDLPKAVHLKLPSKANLSQLVVLGRQLGKSEKLELGKIEAVKSFFRRNEFTAELGVISGTESSGAHPVEKFLFETKRGNCELFATSAALLLRSMGIPTRLVSGFRVSLPPQGTTMITVKNTDAHAWVEAWVEKRGWIPLDFTPTLPKHTTWSAWDEFYDRVGVYWYLYILGYEFDAKEWRLWLEERRISIALAVSAAGVLFLLWQAFKARARWRKGRSPRERAKAEYLRLERKICRNGEPLPLKLMSIPRGNDWKAAYEAARFGRDEPSPATLSELRSESDQLIKEASSRQ